MKINKNIKLISKDSKFFPKNLYNLSDCPDVLFVLGNEKILNNFSISIIGTRNSSKLGNEIAFDLANKLAYNNITIVSGMASGIDTQAHTGALSNPGFLANTTIAIIACGFNHIFTSKNKSLIDKIIQNNGAIISEYFPDSPPQNFSFLRRNRLIAAISEALIVIEAPLKSGALNTAQTAKKLSKPVFVIPWNINIIKGQGCNNLLKDSAHILTDYTQILSFFNIPDKYVNAVNSLNNSNHETPQIINIPKEFIKLYDYISQNSPITKNNIYSNFQEETIATINSKLILMELQNIIIAKR